MLLTALILSLVGIAIYSLRLHHAVARAPQLHLAADVINGDFDLRFPQVSVIIPAYNEAENIKDCVTSVLNSTKLSAPTLEVWVIDDESTDGTLAIAQDQLQQLGDPRLKIMAGQPRPANQTWVGKNWACAQGAEQAKGEFLLFIDADVRLQPGAIETAVETVKQGQVDLLSCWSAVVCGCLAGWVVQPLALNVLIMGFDFVAVNDPKRETAYAIGTFMLFRRSAYKQVGGHRAIASQTVDDLELARRIKRLGLKLQYVLAPELSQVRMYRSWAALWEGWTKNLYLGSQRNLWLMLYLASAMVAVLAFPWLGLLFLLGKYFVTALAPIDSLAIGLALMAILLQYNLRRMVGQIFHFSPRYWWLSGLGGVIFAAITLASVIKTETGWGWTWRGRVLSSPSFSDEFAS